MPANDRKLLTVEEVAQRLHSTVEAINQMVAAGKLAGYRLGGEFVRFRREDVEALARTLRVPGARLSWLERVREFLYLHDFYLMAALLTLLLIAVLIRFA